jgi:hypothetical protein
VNLILLLALLQASAPPLRVYFVGNSLSLTHRNDLPKNCCGRVVSYSPYAITQKWYQRM